MHVFPQSCLPLTSALRLTGSKDNVENRKSLEQQGTAYWWWIVDSLKGAIQDGESRTEFSWDYDGDSLWNPRLRDHWGKRISYYKSHEERVLNLLRVRTYWYNRLPKSGKNKVKRLVKTRSGRSHLKEIINTCDGVLVSLMFSFPELFTEGYTFSDRVTNSIMMNCFHNYAKFQSELKLIRKTVKQQYMSSSHVDLDRGLMRTFSWLKGVQHTLNNLPEGSKRSKSAIFRVACFTQTRATGLADKVMCEKTVEEFLSEVTCKREFQPNSLLTKSRDAILGILCKRGRVGTNPEFKISVSNSACFESSKRNGGKFQMAKDMIKSLGLRIPDLAEGIPGTLGNALFEEARKRSLNPYLLREACKVNVAAIRENGKCRVVTSGSFWKETALQPYSHITIHLIKTMAHLRNGLQAGKLGWQFMRGLHSDELGQDFIWSFDKDRYLFSTDWSKATDKPTKQMAWWLVGTLLELCGLSAPDLQMVKAYWLSDKEMWYKKSFVGVMVNGVPMGDPLTKTCLSLAHPIVDTYARSRVRQLAKEEGNGDDTIAICQSPEYAFAHQEAAEMLGYETSALDTFVTKDWGTYCEEWFHLPFHKSNTLKTAMKTRKLDLLPYLDVPKIRTMIGTEKDKDDYSSDITGKVTLLGKDEEYLSCLDSGPYATLHSIASSIQDCILSTIHQPEPLHLPRQIFGAGKAPPGWNAKTWLSIMNNGPAWKKNLYGWIMRDCVAGRNLKIPSSYCKENRHFTDEPWVECLDIPPDHPVRQYMVVSRQDAGKFPGTVLQKLAKNNLIVPHTKLLKYFMFQERIDEIQSVDRDLFARVREQALNVAELPINDSDLEELIGEFKKRFRANPWSLRRDLEVDYYSTEAVSILELGNPLVVTQVDFPLIMKFSEAPGPRTRYEEALEDLSDWFWGARLSILNDEEFDQPPQDILDDDPIILRIIEDESSWCRNVFIITDDLKLCRFARDSFPGVCIRRISNEKLFRATDDYEPDSMNRFMDQILDIYKCQKDSTLVLPDTGNMESWLELRGDAKGAIAPTAGIPWTKDVKASNYSFKRTMSEATTLTKSTPQRLGYTGMKNDSSVDYVFGAKSGRGR